MNKIILSLFLLLQLIAANAQQKVQSQKASFNQNGISGEVMLDISVNYNFEPYFVARQGNVVITSYQNGKYNDILRQNGITFPYKLNKAGRFDFTIHALIQKGQHIIERVSVDFNTTDGLTSGQTFPPFSKQTLEWLKNEGGDRSIVGRGMSGGESPWSKYARFQNAQVRSIYLNDFKNTVESIVSKTERETANKTREFDSQIQRAQLLANEGNIAGAEEALKKAKSMAGSDQSMNTKVRSAEGLVANRKAHQQQAKTQSSNTSVGARTASSTTGSTQSNTQRGATQSSSTTGSTTGNTNLTTQNQNSQPSQETQQQMARIYQQMEDNQRKANELRAATDETAREWASGNYIKGSAALANTFARQGDAVGAYSTIGVGIGMQVGSLLAEGKRKREAAREAERVREAELEAERAEKARVEKRRIDMILSTRASVLNEYSWSKAIPLSTSKESADRIYYFMYDVNKTDRERERTTVYVSNVFEVGRFNDGTWPYQSAIENELLGTTPYGNRVLHGYYTSKEDAENMRRLFVDQLQKYGGATITEVAYKGKPAATSLSHTGTKVASSDDQGTVQSRLGIPIGKGKTSKTTTSSKSTETKKTTGSTEVGSLGIPIKMKK